MAAVIPQGTKKQPRFLTLSYLKGEKELYNLNEDFFATYKIYRCAVKSFMAIPTKINPATQLMIF